VLVGGRRRRCEVYVGLPAVMHPQARAPGGRHRPASAG
jgi:hypothetical protein